jgi:hypothetical protein
MSVPSSFVAVAIVVGTAFTVGCGQRSSPTSPSSSISSPNSAVSTSRVAVPAPATGTLTPTAVSGRPEYELAYYNGTIVTMNHISVPQNPGALAHAAADLYAVFYPANHALWPAPPLCNPCDHPGPPGDPRNYHDHILDSIPSDPGHGEFNALWHVFAILPANSLPATQAAYAARLPMTSEAAVDAAIAAGVAREIDTGSYFLCSIVNAHAAP